MRKLLSYLVMSAAALVMTVNVAHAQEKQERGTSKQAVAMVKKAIAHYKAVGKEQAFTDFGDAGNTDFHKGDLYIFVYDNKGVSLAHGNNPRLVGKNLHDLKDLDGKLLIKEFIDLTNAKGSGWVDYKWPNPVTKAVESKTAYVEKVDNIIIGSGIYK